MLLTSTGRQKRLPTDALLWAAAGCAAVLLVAVLVFVGGCGRTSPHSSPLVLLAVTQAGSGDGDGDVPYRLRPLQRFVGGADAGAGVGRVADAATVMPWDYYVPTHECTRGEDVVGRGAHGRGVWLCGVLSLLQAPSCVVYVAGADEPSAFEREILRLTPCHVHVFSPLRAAGRTEEDKRGKQEEREQEKGRLHVHAFALGVEDAEGARTPAGAMAALGHDHADLVVVAPHRESLPVASALAHCPRWVGQVVLGVHYSPAVLRAATTVRRLAMQRDFAALNETMVRAGFALVRREENNFRPRTVQMLYGSLLPRPSHRSV